MFSTVWQRIAQARSDAFMWSPLEIKPPLERAGDLLHSLSYRAQSFILECLRVETGTRTQPLVASCSYSTCFSAVPSGACARLITCVLSFSFLANT